MRCTISELYQQDYSVHLDFAKGEEDAGGVVPCPELVGAEFAPEADVLYETPNVTVFHTATMPDWKGDRGHPLLPVLVSNGTVVGEPVYVSTVGSIVVAATYLGRDERGEGSLRGLVVFTRFGPVDLWPSVSHMWWGEMNKERAIGMEGGVRAGI